MARALNYLELLNRCDRFGALADLTVGQVAIGAPEECSAPTGAGNALSTIARLSAASNRLELAEREGFEPPIRLPVCRISSAVHSTALPPLRKLATRPERCGAVSSGAGDGTQERRFYSSRPSLRSSEYGPPPR